MEIKTVIYSRKSPDFFNAKKVEDTTLKTIVEAGNYAPIFGSLHFTIINNPEIISLIKNTTISMMKGSGNDFLEKQASDPNYNPICNAPTMIILSAPNGNDMQGFNMANVGCAAQNIMLMGADLGISTRYVMAPVMALSHPEIAEKIRFPENHLPLAMILAGYSDNQPEKRNIQKDNISFIK